MKYINASKDALDQPAIENCTLSTQEIEAVIGFISEQLKEPMSNEERLMLVADRSELRATLKQRGGGRVLGEKSQWQRLKINTRQSFSAGGFLRSARKLYSLRWLSLTLHAAVIFSKA